MSRISFCFAQVSYFMHTNEVYKIQLFFDKQTVVVFTLNVDPRVLLYLKRSIFFRTITQPFFISTV